MLVMKFGGASVATPESFLKIAEIVCGHIEQNRHLAVVVSAMGNATDRLFELAYAVNKNPPRRELDMLVSTGERVSCALLAMALAEKGVEAVSFTGSQSGIITNDVHSDARIIDVRPRRLLAAFEEGKIAIVAGFQGVSRKGEITTLGRGGSDTTAVALAAALRSPQVIFYKDVAGIFSADPKRDESACLLTKLSYKEALFLAQKGAKVLHHRSIILAKKNGIGLSVRSFYHPFEEGTEVKEEGANVLECGYEEEE